MKRTLQLAIAPMLLAGLWTGFVACDSGPGRVVLAYNLPVWGDPIVAVVREEIAEWQDPRLQRIELVRDTSFTGGPADRDIASAERISADPDLIGVVGHGGSRESLLAATVYNESEVVQIVPIGTSRLLERAGPWTFSLAPNDSLEGIFIADYIADELQGRSVVIFYVNDEYGVGLRDGVIEALTDRGVAILDERPAGTSGDYDVLLQAAMQSGTPDVVVSAMRPMPTGALAQSVHRYLPEAVLVAGDGALLLPDLAVTAGEAIDLVHAVAFWTPESPDSLSRAFVERFRRRVGRDPVARDAMAYDALMVLVQAVREVGPSRHAVRRYLREIGDTRPPYRGVSGDVSFGPDRPARLVMVHIEDGRAVPDSLQ